MYRSCCCIDKEDHHGYYYDCCNNCNKKNHYRCAFPNGPLSSSFGYTFPPSRSTSFSSLSFVCSFPSLQLSSSSYSSSPSIQCAFSLCLTQCVWLWLYVHVLLAFAVLFLINKEIHAAPSLVFIITTIAQETPRRSSTSSSRRRGVFEFPFTGIFDELSNFFQLFFG